jgi:fatty-acyl-CoA synthase
MDSLASVIAVHAKETPERTALRFGAQALSYGELDARILDAARWLRQVGVARGDRVAWLGANHPGEIVLLFALAKLGAMLLPLNYRLAPAEWDRLVRECAPVCVVHDETWAEAASALAERHGVRCFATSLRDSPERAADCASDATGDAQVGAMGDAPADLPVLLVATSAPPAAPRPRCTRRRTCSPTCASPRRRRR